MAGALRRAGLTLALPALVGVSTLLHWLAGRRLDGLWIMPDEAIYAERAIGFWRHLSLPVLHGQGAGYSVLYPIVAGIPFAAGGIYRGYVDLKLMQALIASLSAVPVYFYGRRIMSPGYALLAAALTVASPLLLYSGLVMTEVLAYPLSALALLAIARAVETATLRDQAIAFVCIAATVLTRVQSVVLVVVFACALLVDAVFARDRRRLRAFWPVWVVVGIGVVVVAALPAVFGAYAATLSRGYPLLASARFVYYHLAFITIQVAVAPVAALLVLAVLAARGRERDPAARAVIAVALCATVLVSLEVGLFAARYAPHLLGRDVAAATPMLFVVFALWLARGCPRPAWVASIVVLAIVALVVGAPWNELVAKVAAPDTFGIALFLRHGFAEPATLIAIGVAAALVLFRFVPRRASLLLAALVFGMLVVSSVSASNLIADNVRYAQENLVGAPRDWIGRTTSQPVAYVYAGDLESWNVVWEQRFWNPQIRDVVSIAPYFVPGPLPSSRQISMPADGEIPISDRFVVANDEISFAGTPVAHQSRGTLDYGLTLWKLDPPAQLTAITHGVKPNGDIIGDAGVTAYGCRGGQLQLTLLPKATNTLEVFLDGKRALTASIGGRTYWNGTVYVPRSHTSNVCTFTIKGGLLLGSTRIVFQPAEP